MSHVQAAVRTPRRLGVVLFAVAVLAGAGSPAAWAHAALEEAQPAPGAELQASPTGIRLSFSEQPQASLSKIEVVDEGGRSYRAGPVEAVRGDPLSIVAPLPRLGRGVYVVNWRIVSAVDGHATAGAYSFGIGVSPGAGVLATSTSSASASKLEMLARWLLIGGLVVLLGAATAGVARFGGGRELGLGASGWALAAGGLLLLAVAQRRTAGASYGELFHTSVGHALGWRALAIVLAGVALVAARLLPPRFRRLALAGAGAATITAMVVHVSAGHAAGASHDALRIAEQSAHFAAVGIWLGGLGALLLGLRGAPSSGKAASVRRFSSIAAVGIVVVATTGVLRAVHELTSWADLLSTGYGRAVLIKIGLLVAIAALGALNRRRNVSRAALTLHPLRRAAGGELLLAAVALAAAAVLGSLAPPAASRVAAPEGLEASGADAGTTTRVKLTTFSDQPGPNTFTAEIAGYDSKEPVRAGRVTLRFTPLDDPGVAPTNLRLRPSSPGTYVGSGQNLAFDGRWGVRALVERGRRTVAVPLELDVPTPPQEVSVERIPGQPTNYSVAVSLRDVVRFTPVPERPGPSKVTVTFFGVIGDEELVKRAVVTAPRPAGRRARSRSGASTDSAASLRHSGFSRARTRSPRWEPPWKGSASGPRSRSTSGAELRARRSPG